MGRIQGQNEEQERLQEIRSYDILDTAPEKSFDDLIWLAAQLFQVPISTIGYMDADRLWLKAKMGIPRQNLSRESTVCSWVVENKQAMVISDLWEDSRFQNHPVAKNGLGLRFYVSQPLISKRGFVLGTLCVMDVMPRYPSEHQLRGLEILASQVVEKMELRKSDHTIQSQEIGLAEGLRLRSLGQMSGSIAHEINNPLAIILGRTQLLRKLLEPETVDRTRILKDLQIIEDTCDRIVKVVKGFLRMSRDAKHDPFEKTSILRLVQEVKDLMGPRLDKNRITFELKGPEDLMFECRPIEISQVLMNLVGNSIDALAGCSEKKILLAWYYLNDKMILSVSDTGPGIPLNIQQSIMRPFFTTKPPDQGTGLGLSISKNICESHGGSLHLQTPSTQTEFILTLPLQQLEVRKTSEQRMRAA